MAINVKSPSSYFFTDIGFTQYTDTAYTVLDPAFKSFGQLDSNTFQITTTFKGALNAFAVAKGTVLIARQEGTTDKINILLRPTGDIGLGIKIKYFVYRGIDASHYFKNFPSTPSVKETSSLEFIINAWDAFTEFNESTGDLAASQIGLIDASSGINTDVLKKYFKKGGYNLLRVDGGSPLGNFATDSGGFEIVLDEGDFLQQNSDTGLVFTDKFATAKESVLKANGNNSDTKIFGGNVSTVDAKIFKENIFKFLDPAAFYGSHVTNNATNANTGSICLKGTTVSYSSMNDIYNQFIKKFKNRFITYFYVKGNRNRNLNFYNTTINSLKINGSVQNLATALWPVLSFDSVANRSIEITDLKIEDSLYSSTLLKAASALSIPKEDYLFTKVTGTYTCNLPFINISGSNKVYSSFTYLFFNGSTTNINDNFFGPVDLNSIFEQADFTAKKIATVNHLRPILVRQNEDVGHYSTKVILDGYISDSDPINIPTDPAILAKTLRTYVIFPQNTSVQLATNSKILNAGYYGLFNTSDEYCKKIYGAGEIWKGIIKDGTVEIKSLLFRRKDNDYEMPIYQLGISQLDYNKLVDRSIDPTNIDSNATNMFFCFKNESIDPNGSFLKYSLQIRYDKANGTTAETKASVTVYTIDGYFFFTKDYSDNFDSKYYEEFADTTVEFRPNQDWDGEFGMDWYRKGQYTWADTTGDKIYDVGFAGNVGTLPNQTDGNQYIDPLGAPFLPDNKMLLKLKSREYNAYSVSWSLADNETECFTSWLSIDKGKTAKLNLRIRVKKVASKLSIRYPNKYFKINNTNGYTDPSDINFSFFDFPATVKAITTTARFFDLDINCIEEFGTTQVLEVKADDKLAGMLKVFPNANKRVQNVLFVPVKIEMPDGTERNFSSSTPNTDPDPVAADYIAKQKKSLEKFLLQSQIKANIEMFNDGSIPLVGDDYRQLDLTSDINFNKEFAPDNANVLNNKGMFIRKIGTVYSLRAYYQPLKTNRLDLKKYLTEHLPANYQDAKYKNYLIVFFMNTIGRKMIDDNIAEIGTLNGLSSGTGTDLLVFKLDNDNNETVSHEVYHSLGIQHTFNKLDVNSLYVYQYAMTDNLLDYTHHKSHSTPPYKKFDRRSLYHWQWIIARKNIKK
ncbi:hypothetical protein [Chryseobacterium sp.]|uniref:hypothetical protein n=1 Tax=Chryseobacterium sp. TaxID=1871047 RepID=UPI0012A9BABE|nr:hypothetical protein [Chryseobacterium sp.]QFG54456.1 hypothetical protein F7R58_12635 [Chryseobacterium sp.]